MPTNFSDEICYFRPNTGYHHRIVLFAYSPQLHLNATLSSGSSVLASFHHRFFGSVFYHIFSISLPLALSLFFKKCNQGSFTAISLFRIRLMPGGPSTYRALFFASDNWLFGCKTFNWNFTQKQNTKSPKEFQNNWHRRVFFSFLLKSVRMIKFSFENILSVILAWVSQCK